MARRVPELGGYTTAGGQTATNTGGLPSNPKDRKPSGRKIPRLTSPQGDLEEGSVFARSDPYARKPGRAGGR